MKKASLRAVGYRRVSMSEQVKGHSLDAQTNNIQRFIEQQDWELIEIYTEAGRSAKKGSHRPTLDQLMKDAQARKFDVVVVDKIDRFYRHLNSLLTALDKLHQQDVSFASVREKLDFSTPWGKLMLTVLGMLAEIYIDNLRQETRKGKLQRARDGLWNGNIPYGYCRGLCSQCNDPNGKGYCPEYGNPDKSRDDVLIPHPIEGAVVKNVFDWYLSGDYSDGKIADKLNSSYHHFPDGTKLPLRHKGAPGRTKPGKFSTDYVRGILGRIFYTGKVPYYGRTKDGKSRRYKKPKLFEGQHPALVAEVTFNEVQELRATLAPIPRSRCGTKSRVYPLTGVLHCAYCGGPFRGGTGRKGRRYYRDANQIKRVRDCPQPLAKAYKTENDL
ncbi:MAG: recombinase family protein, partial [Chloroflexota bacterium]|nr:recombinase family protein [Chloroflexota bacterium]